MRIASMLVLLLVPAASLAQTAPTCESEVERFYKQLASDPQKYVDEAPASPWTAQLQAIVSQVRINKTDAQQAAGGESQARTTVSRLVETNKLLQERLKDQQSQTEKAPEPPAPKSR